MALAFAGMLASKNTFLNQFGFIMITGVLVDTFAVRVVLVPAILTLGGDAINWWSVHVVGPALATCVLCCRPATMPEPDVNVDLSVKPIE